MRITPAQYMEYIKQAAAAIGGQGEYLTALDAATGDGDHWLNLNIGFEKLLEQADALRAEPDIGALFQKLARLIMTGMGGTSGALYGSMYLAASKLAGDAPALDETLLAEMLRCWADTLMERGNTEPGQKTMVDAVEPAARAYADALERGEPLPDALAALKRAAREGAERTRGMEALRGRASNQTGKGVGHMEALRGRASNQTGKGVGHLDPGAVSMAIQLECLADFLAQADAAAAQ